MIGLGKNEKEDLNKNSFGIENKDNISRLLEKLSLEVFFQYEHKGKEQDLYYREYLTTSKGVKEMKFEVSNFNTTSVKVIIKNILKSKKIKIKQGAELLGIGRPALSNVINGKATLSIELAKKIDKHFGSDNVEFGRQLFEKQMNELYRSSYLSDMFEEV
jgi:predicted transcriptional regulator